MWRSMVCGALWWSPDQTRPLRGQIAKFIFLWHWGTAVSLASGSRLVIPALDRTRPRSPQPHCTHTHFTKNGQRASPCEYLVIIGSPLGTDYCTRPRLFVLILVGPHVDGPWTARMGAALAGPDAPPSSLDFDLQITTAVCSLHGLSACDLCRKISICPSVTCIAGKMSGRNRAYFAFFGRIERDAIENPRGKWYGGAAAARGSGRCCDRAWRAGAGHGQLGRCARWQVCLRQVPGALVRPLQVDEARLGQALRGVC